MPSRDIQHSASTSSPSNEASLAGGVHDLSPKVQVHLSQRTDNTHPWIPYLIQYLKLYRARKCKPQVSQIRGGHEHQGAGLCLKQPPFSPRRRKSKPERRNGCHLPFCIILKGRCDLLPPNFWVCLFLLFFDVMARVLVAGILHFCYTSSPAVSSGFLSSLRPCRIAEE